MIALFWLFLSLVVMFVGMPAAIVLMLVGALLDVVHVHFVSDFVHCMLTQMMKFIRYVTVKIRGLTHQVAAYERNNS